MGAVGWRHAQHGTVESARILMSLQSCNRSEAALWGREIKKLTAQCLIFVVGCVHPEAGPPKSRYVRDASGRHRSRTNKVLCGLSWWAEILAAVCVEFELSRLRVCRNQVEKTYEAQGVCGVKEVLGLVHWGSATPATS